MRRASSAALAITQTAGLKLANGLADGTLPGSRSLGRGSRPQKISEALLCRAASGLRAAKPSATQRGGVSLR